MFNLQSLVAMASQAMLKKLISSDSMYSQLNMVRSVYYKDGQAPQYYADLAFDFLENKDAPEGKAKRYYLAMHCAE